MKKNLILEQLQSSKIKNYSFTIVFFLLFSFFVIFVIRPNIVTVFRSQKELQDLQRIDKEYENVIFSIIKLQSKIQANLPNRALLDQAFPSTPQVNKVIDDLYISASRSGVLLNRIDVGLVNLKEDKTNVTTRSYDVNIETATGFSDVKQFIAALLNQRRLKTIKNLSIRRDDSSSESATIKINFIIEGYYL